MQIKLSKKLSVSLWIVAGGFALALFIFVTQTFSERDITSQYPIDGSLLLTRFIKDDIETNITLKSKNVREQLLEIINVRSISNIFDDVSEPEVFVDDKEQIQNEEESDTSLISAPSQKSMLDNIKQEVSVEPKSLKKEEAPTPRKGFFYVVRSGDSLWSISKKYGLSTLTVCSANNLSEKSKLMVGRRIFIPPRDGVYHKVSRSESLSNIASLYGSSVTKILQSNPITTPNKLQIGQRIFLPDVTKLPSKKSERIFIWPIYGSITSPFGIRKHPIYKRKIFHRGIDISSNRQHKNIHAASDGTIIYSGWYGGYGRMILIKHSGGYYTQYAHNSKNYVKNGQRVKQGQVIGLTGSTGSSLGIHLHFEIRKGTNVLNPTKYLAKR